MYGHVRYCEYNELQAVRLGCSPISSSTCRIPGCHPILSLVFGCTVSLVADRKPQSADLVVCNLLWHVFGVLRSKQSAGDHLPCRSRTTTTTTTTLHPHPPRLQLGLTILLRQNASQLALELGQQSSQPAAFPCKQQQCGAVDGAPQRPNLQGERRQVIPQHHFSLQLCRCIGTEAWSQSLTLSPASITSLPFMAV